MRTHGRAVKRFVVTVIAISFVGCVEHFVSPPVPESEGAFLIHRVRSQDESFPKVLTWYTGTTLSQQLVARHNPVVLQRELRVGDTIKIPVELVANDRPFGEDGKHASTPTVDLLMEGAATSTPVNTVAASSALETFDDENSPDKVPERTLVVPPVASATPDPGVRMKELEREILEREAELQALRGGVAPTSVPAFLAAMPTASLEVLD
jgi:hypothetical protein